MTFQAIYIKDKEKPISRDILEDEKMKKYFINYGFDTDFGYIALEESTRKKIGAIWLRLFKSDNKGWGYVNDMTPELTMAIDETYRGRGIGTTLIEMLLKSTTDSYPNISLSVDPNNKAYHLYSKYGFRECGESGTSVTMILKR
jgi:GNAT superfamily N-acetyltransferase